MENERNYILDIMTLINKLQNNYADSANNSCTKPFLGPSNTTSNTRPIRLFLCNNDDLTISYPSGATTATSNIFRVEDINGSCVTVRLLAGTEGALTSTNEFATINTDCIAAIKCLSDINLLI